MAAMRSATHQIHQELENYLPVGLPNAGPNEYLSYIAALWGWMSPFEQSLWNAEWPQEMQAGERKGKSLWLKKDLLAAGWDTASIDCIPLAGFMPDLDSMAARFGAAYVIEGAQLGTQVLGKRLAPALAPWSPRWLEGYGHDTGKKWRIFMECSERMLDSEEACKVASNAARASFESLAAWFKMQTAA